MNDVNFTILNNVAALAPKRKELNGRSLKMTTILVDLDGTLAVWDESSKFDWLAEPERCEKQVMTMRPHYWLISLINSLKSDSVHVYVVTARREAFRELTSKWLHHNGIKHNGLLMRPEGEDHRHDWEVKQDILALVQERYKVWFVIEDRKSVVAMWRRNGVDCLQCADGDY